MCYSREISASSIRVTPDGISKLKMCVPFSPKKRSRTLVNPAIGNKNKFGGVGASKGVQRLVVKLKKRFQPRTRYVSALQLG